jgi:hypothetical protein
MMTLPPTHATAAKIMTQIANRPTHVRIPKTSACGITGVAESMRIAIRSARLANKFRDTSVGRATTMNVLTEMSLAQRWLYIINTPSLTSRGEVENLSKCFPTMMMTLSRTAVEFKTPTMHVLTALRNARKRAA